MKTTTTKLLTRAGLATLLIASVGCGLGGPGPSDDPNGNPTGDPTGSTGDETPEIGDDGCSEGTGNCFYAVEIIDDLTNPTLAPSCDAGTKKSPGADIDGAVLADAEGVIFATLGQCQWKTQPSTCESTSSDLTAAEGNVDLLAHDKPTNLYSPVSRSRNFRPAETDDGDYLALNGGSIQCTWLDIDSRQPTYAKPSDTIHVFEVGGGNGTQTERFEMRVCLEKGGACEKTKGFGSGVASVRVSDLLGQ